MDVDKSKEHRRADHVNVAYKPTVVDIAHDPLDRIKGEVRFRRVKHRQKYAAHDHDHEHDAAERSEVPPIAEITWCRIIDEFAVEVREDRQAVINPADDWISGGGHGFGPVLLVGAGSDKAEVVGPDVIAAPGHEIEFDVLAGEEADQPRPFHSRSMHDDCSATVRAPDLPV